MVASLLIPRVTVFWGKHNLTEPKDVPNWDQSDGPLVYDVKSSLYDAGQLPGGSFKWNPSGKAYNAYVYFLENLIEEQIVVTFYYAGKNAISMVYVWSGQSESYGSDMSIEIKLISELDALINSNIRSTADVHDTPVLVTEGITKIEEAYGIKEFHEELVKVTESVEADLTGKDSPKLQFGYASGTTFASSVQNLVMQVGAEVMATNIVVGGNPVGASRLIVYNPFSWNGGDTVEIPGDDPSGPLPEVRYGYFLGPGIINSLNKSTSWQPPQRENIYLPSTTQKIQKANREEKQRQREAKANTVQYNQDGSVKKSRVSKKPNPTWTEEQAAAAAWAKGGAGGTVRRVRKGIRLENNEAGEKKKILMQEEKGSKLSASVFMCPALVGIKPTDIIYLPNFRGDFIEDWIISSVEYSQTNGGVDVSIQAERTYGLGKPMNEEMGQKWLLIAKAYGLVGTDSTLESWTNYAWSVDYTATAQNLGGSGAGTAVAAPVSGSAPLDLDTFVRTPNPGGQPIPVINYYDPETTP